MPIDAIVFDAYGTLYDVQSVSHVAVAVAPDQGLLLTHLWRMKQLEYSWLHTLIGDPPDFDSITRDALLYATDAIGLSLRDAEVDTLCAGFERLMPYEDTLTAIDRLQGRRLAILSNGTSASLDALVEGSGLKGRFEAVISVEAAGRFKPAPEAYALVEQRLGIAPANTLLVSSNGFDIAGARSFGFEVARIARPATDSTASSHPGSSEIFRALRMRDERLGLPAQHTLSSLEELPQLLDRLA